jgi:hypothetical protein
MNGFIYAIKNETSDNVYVGSTVKSLEERFTTHKGNYKLWLKGKYTYVTSFEIIKCPTAYIEYIEGCDIEDLADREDYWIQNTKCVNMRNGNSDNYVETRPQYLKDYVEKNKEKIKEYKRMYFQKNKDNINQKRNENKEEFNLLRRIKYAEKKAKGDI